MENLNRKYKDKNEFDKEQEELRDEIKKLADEILYINVYLKSDTISEDERTKLTLERTEKYQLVDELGTKVYTKTPNMMSLYHNLFISESNILYIDLTFPNEKYENKLGQEAVFDKDGNWVTGMNAGTYNIGTLKGNRWIKGGKEHNIGVFSDVEMWVRYGIGPEDELTMSDRQKISQLGKSQTLNLDFKLWRATSGRELI